jgi:CheY-like chemotaxis protein
MQAQKLDAIEKLTGGIAHDFNNMLTVVIGTLDRLRQSLAGDPQVLRRVELALEGAHRCTDLTRRLLAFGRRQSLQSATVDLNSVIEGIADLARQVIGEEIEFVIELSSEPCPAHIDPVQIESALLNLVVNARDAMPDGGRLAVAASPALASKVRQLEGTLDSSADYVALAVSDTGVGIPPEIIDRVFDPFFTTKSPGQGSGLGLSIIYGFIKQSGGHIQIESEVGRGTTATIFLPRAAPSEDASADEPSEQSPPLARAGEVVLAVEDDAAVREIASGMLRDLGYHVLEAADGPAAIEVLQRVGPIDLLFTDLAMPGGLSGRELAAIARQLRPGLKVLVTSAHTDQLLEGADGDSAVLLLNKPYRAQELARAVRAAIDRA